MLTVDKSNDYKEGYRDALKMVLDMTIDSVKADQTLLKVIVAAGNGIIEAEQLLELPYN